MVTLDELLERLDAPDEREVCDACFLECRARNSTSKFPCSEELRKWAREHRDVPGAIEEWEAR